MAGKDKRVQRMTDMEFAGVPGAVAMVTGLPLAVMYINLACNRDTCNLFPLPVIYSLNELWDNTAAAIVVLWFGFQVALHMLPVGNTALGLPLQTGKRLRYRCNAFFSLVVSMVMFLILYILDVDVTYIYHNFIPMATASIVFAFLLSVCLYVKSLWARNCDLAPGGSTGYFIYDFFMGRELNPRVGALDVKFFCELRPGLIGWVMFDLAFVTEAINIHGHVPLPLMLVVGFHLLYVADALWHEEAILTTMDIVHDGFGFMLTFGDLAWVPFLYSLQARFLLEHHRAWPFWILSLIFVVNMLGYLIFRGSNSQKNLFRKDPHGRGVAYLESIETSTGRRLLISGWWGICRHPNYLGDLIMSLSWSLPCGFHYILPYFYPIYFLGLLVHRNSRDEANCRRKYGKDWERYCSIVKYRIFPYIY